MKFNVEDIGRHLVEYSNGKTVIRVHAKDKKGLARLASGFSIKIEIGLDRT